MGFKNDNQRKAVMATLNNGASTRQNTSAISQLRNSKSTSNIQVKSQINAIRDITKKDVKTFREDIKTDEKLIRENKGREFLYATRISGTNIITPTMLNKGTEASFDLGGIFLIGDNKKFYHYKDGKMNKISKDEMYKQYGSYKKHIGWKYDDTQYTDGVYGAYSNKDNVSIQLKKETNGTIGGNNIKYSVTTRNKGVVLNKKQYDSYKKARDGSVKEVEQYSKIR